MQNQEESNDLKWEAQTEKLTWKLLSLRLFLASFISVILVSFNFEYLESFFYDLRMRLSPVASSTGLFELVYLDLHSIETLKGRPGATLLQEIVRKISADQPRFILYDDDISALDGTKEDKRALAQYLSEIPGFYVLLNQLELKGTEGALNLPDPYGSVPFYPAPKTKDLKIFAQDGVTRRMLVSYQNQPLLHAHIAQEYLGRPLETLAIRGIFEFANSQQLYFQFRPAGFYPENSFEEILLRGVSSGKFRNKIVIIGTDTSLTSEDYVLTPWSRDIQAMTTVEMHANMIDTLIQNQGLNRWPKLFNGAMVFLISLLVIHVVLSLTPGKGILLLLATLFGYSLLSLILFFTLRAWISVVHPLIAIFLVYYFFIPYRLIMENRRSWEYYHKHRLLSRVEELKTNFISMMSHDLKTPIARIQGMVDRIVRDQTPLSSIQRDSVDTIRTSAEDLLKFINAILAYGRIESEGMELHLQTRDVNKILEESIKKHEFLARLKRITIISELEPLFPVALDPELIHHVFSNILENAIKYSPEGTKILIISEEGSKRPKGDIGSDFISIQFTDQGPGISLEDQNNIFMKFFRSRNHKSSPIKGSGLGLYLAKYFIEMHKGKIFVESSLGQGSTFFVELPLNLNAEGEKC